MLPPNGDDSNLKHWTQLGEAAIPGTAESLLLFRGKDDFFIKISSGGGELMSTRKHGSEDALGALPCRRLRHRASPKVLIGGLGMGFTLAAVLKEVGPGAEVTVAELIPEVVEWNRGPLGECSGKPLDDPRTRVHVGDVMKLLRSKRKSLRCHRTGCRQWARGADQDFKRLALLRGRHCRNPGSVEHRWHPGLLVRRAGPGVSRPAQALRFHGGGSHGFRAWPKGGQAHDLAGRPVSLTLCICRHLDIDSRLSASPHGPVRSIRAVQISS